MKMKEKKARSRLIAEPALMMEESKAAVHGFRGESQASGQR